MSSGPFRQTVGGRVDDVPAGGRLVSAAEYVGKANEMIYNWQPRSQVLALYAGPGLAALAALFPHSFLFRRLWAVNKMPLGGAQGTPPYHIAGTCFPALVTFVAHMEFARKPVILQNPACSVCRELRAITIQQVLGFAFPAVMAFGGVWLHIKLNYVRLKDKNLFNWILQMGKKSQKILIASFAFQTLWAAAIHYRQEYEWQFINEELVRRKKDSLGIRD